MRARWEARATRLLWPTRIALFAIAGLIGYRAYFESHGFVVARDGLAGVSAVSAIALLVGLAAAAWVGFTYATLYRLNPPDPDRAARPGLFGAITDRLVNGGEPMLAFVALAGIAWFGYSPTLPEMMHTLAAKTPATMSLKMNGDYRFDGSRACATSTGFAEGYGFVTICLPEDLRDRVDGHFGVEVMLHGKASRYGFSIESVALR